MRKIILILSMILSLSQLGFSKETTYRARVTYYFQAGKKVAWQKVKVAVEGESVAAHPDFEFGTKISIPALRGIVGDGEYTIHDRGPAVTKKVASRGKEYVIDVFVNSNKKIKHLAKTAPMYMSVIVHE